MLGILQCFYSLCQKGYTTYLMKLNGCVLFSCLLNIVFPCVNLWQVETWQLCSCKLVVQKETLLKSANCLTWMLFKFRKEVLAILFFLLMRDSQTLKLFLHTLMQPWQLPLLSSLLPLHRPQFLLHYRLRKLHPSLHSWTPMLIA